MPNMAEPRPGGHGDGYISEQLEKIHSWVVNCIAPCLRERLLAGSQVGIKIHQPATCGGLQLNRGMNKVHSKTKQFSRLVLLVLSIAIASAIADPGSAIAEPRISIEQERAAIESQLAAARDRLRTLSRTDQPNLWSEQQLTIGAALASLREYRGHHLPFDQILDHFDKALSAVGYKVPSAAGNFVAVELIWQLAAEGTRTLNRELARKAVESGEAAYSAVTPAISNYMWRSVQLAYASALRDYGIFQDDQGLNEFHARSERLMRDLLGRRGTAGLTTSERVLTIWAVALLLLDRADLSGRYEGLDEAVDLSEQVLAADIVDDSPQFWIAARQLRVFALTEKAKATNDRGLLEEALNHCGSMLGLDGLDLLPAYQGRAYNCRATTLVELAERGGDASSLDEAVALHRKALKLHDVEHQPADWAYTQTQLGKALVALARRDNNGQPLVQGLAAYRSALRTYEARGAIQYAKYVARHLAEAEILRFP